MLPKRLSVNLDHVATLRQVRGTPYPVLASAVGVCELAGAHGITLHLREDRRHIQDRDVELVREISLLPLTLEMGATHEMVGIAKRVRPHMVTLVPESREELTTEGGLDAIKLKNNLASVVTELHGAGIKVCLFLEPEVAQLEVARDLECEAVELHTGRYALCFEEGDFAAELKRIEESVREGMKLGLQMNAGHGLEYRNIGPLSLLAGIREFSIGHGIVCRAVFVGLERAVAEMLRLC